jgi:hypothetical protein
LQAHERLPSKEKSSMFSDLSSAANRMTSFFRRSSQSSMRSKGSSDSLCDTSSGGKVVGSGAGEKKEHVFKAPMPVTPSAKKKKKMKSAAKFFGKSLRKTWKGAKSGAKKALSSSKKEGGGGEGHDDVGSDGGFELRRSESEGELSPRRPRGGSFSGGGGAAASDGRLDSARPKSASLNDLSAMDFA